MVESSILSSAFFCFFLHLDDTPLLLVDFQPIRTPPGAPGVIGASVLRVRMERFSYSHQLADR